jgi:DNA-binding NarL/FixJ family response regulator
MTGWLVIIDGSPGVRRVVERLAAQHGWGVAGSVSRLEMGITLTRIRQPDLVLIDLPTPEAPGPIALLRIREAAPRAAIVIMTDFPGYLAGQPSVVAAAHAIIAKSDLTHGLVRQLADILGDDRDRPQRDETSG